MCETVQENTVNYAKEYAKKYAKEHANEYIKEYVEKYVAEAVQIEYIQIAINFLRHGGSVDLLVKSIPSLSRQLVVELSKQLRQPVD